MTLDELPWHVQGSPGWLNERCGKVTASRVCDVVATTRSSGYSASRSTYMAELLCERLTGVPTEKFVSAAMQNGTELEPEARNNYAFHADCDVVQVGFITHPTIPSSGCSPDGCIGEHGLVEIKCPQPAAHIEILLSGKVPQRYATQMQFQMATTGRQWNDLVSYCPKLPEAMRLFVTRVKRDQSAINILEREVRLFLKDLDEKERLLRNKFLKDEL